MIAVTAGFTSRKIINQYDWDKQGTAPSGASTVSVRAQEVRLCLQMCQQNVILNNCRAINYYWETEACDLINDYATEITDVTHAAYWEVVIGQHPYFKKDKRVTVGIVSTNPGLPIHIKHRTCIRLPI